MNQKEKPCQGINKAKSFKGCGKETLYRKSGLCMECYGEFLYDTKEGQEIINKTVLSLRGKREKINKDFQEASKKHEAKQKLQSHIESTKKIVHKYIKLRDEGNPCISCGIPWKDDFEAGHYHKAELFSSIKFDFDNIFAQCRVCNNHKEGNLELYTVNLPNKIGVERFNALNKRAALSRKYSKHWTRHELAEIRKQAKELINKLF